MIVSAAGEAVRRYIHISSHLTQVPLEVSSAISKLTKLPKYFQAVFKSERRDKVLPFNTRNMKISQPVLSLM